MNTPKIIQAVVDIDRIFNGGYDAEQLDAISKKINSESGKITKIVAAPTLFTSPRDDVSRPYAVALIIYYEDNAEDYKPFFLDISAFQAISNDIYLGNTDPNGTVLMPYGTQELILITARYTEVE